MKNKNIFILSFRILVSGALLFALFYLLRNTVSLDTLLSIVRESSYILLGGLAATTVLLLFIRTLNWRMLLSGVHTPLPKTRNLFFSILAAQPLNIFIPGKGGEVVRFVYLRNDLPIALGFGSVLFERIIDLIALFLLSSIGLFFIPHPILTWVSVGGIVILLAGTFILFSSRAFGFFKRCITSLVRIEKVSRFLDDLEAFLSRVRREKGKIVAFIAIALLQWVITLFQSYGILIALGATAPFFEVVTRVPIGIVATLIPISFGGLGTREAAFLFLFKDIIQPETVIAFTLLFYMLRYVIPGTLGIPFLTLIRGRKARGGTHEK